MATPSRREESVAENQRIAAYARWEHSQPDSTLLFLCECDDAVCRAFVRWTLEEYDTVRADAGFVLAAGHRIAAGGLEPPTSGL